MQTLLFISANSVSVDQQRNTLSIFHIIEELSSPAFPFALPSFFVAALFSRTGEEPNVAEGAEIVISHDGREILRHALTLNFQGRLRLRTVVEVGGLAVAGSGTLLITAIREGRDMASWPIIIRSIARPTAQVELGV